MEGVRQAGTAAVHFHAAAADTLVVDDAGTAVPVQAGDRVTVRYVSPSSSPSFIPLPF